MANPSILLFPFPQLLQFPRTWEGGGGGAADQPREHALRLFPASQQSMWCSLHFCLPLSAPALTHLPNANSAAKGGHTGSGGLEQGRGSSGRGNSAQLQSVFYAATSWVRPDGSYSCRMQAGLDAWPQALGKKILQSHWLSSCLPSEELWFL